MGLLPPSASDWADKKQAPNNRKGGEAIRRLFLCAISDVESIANIASRFYNIVSLQTVVNDKRLI
jgi:hypothetical protein